MISQQQPTTLTELLEPPEMNNLGKYCRAIGKLFLTGEKSRDVEEPSMNLCKMGELKGFKDWLSFLFLCHSLVGNNPPLVARTLIPTAMVLVMTIAIA